MPKRTSIPRWEDLKAGGADRWAQDVLTSSPNTPEDWRQALLDDILPKPDTDFETDDVGAPTMSTTSSSNPSRPRTLKAGYDYKNQVLTVVFRDGTWWEYRGVPENMWLNFKSSESKGKYLRESGLDSWGDMGPADVTNMSRARRAQLNDVKKFAEYMYED